MGNNDIEKELEAHVQQLIQNELGETGEDIQKKNEFKLKVKKDFKIVKCKKCLKTGTWTASGHFPNGCKKWRDEDGLICNGRLCGKCNRDRAGKTMRKIRSQD